VSKYGFKIEELGPKFGQQKLHEQAMTLIQDYEVLTAAMIPQENIIKRMGPALQDYVSTSLRAGLQIPENLRPVLTRMAELGLLTDENGEKMTDLSRLKFSESLDAKFSTLLDTIKELTDAISRGLSGALVNLPKPEAPWSHWPSPPGMPDYTKPGWQEPQTQQTEYAAEGKFIAFRPRGTDVVPAMLTPGERVLSVADNLRYENAQKQQLPPQKNYYITNEWSISTPVNREELMKLYLKSIEDNIGGARTETREALGVE
jgi:hypothetical protein